MTEDLNYARGRFLGAAAATVAAAQSGITEFSEEGDANGAPHVEPSAYANKFSSKYEHRTVPGGIGHNLPQEARQAFAQAVIDVDRYSAGG